MLARLREALTPSARAERVAHRCLSCGNEFDAPARRRVQCPACLGFRVEQA